MKFIKGLVAGLVLPLLASIAVAQGIPNVGANGVPNAAPGVQANLNASSDPLATNDLTQGYQVGSVWQNATTGRIFVARSVVANSAVWLPLELANHPGYIVGNWYVGYDASATQAGTAPGSGSIRLYPAYIKERITINALGVRVSTLSGGGNVQAAVYANNAATGRPTGNALVASGSMSTTSVASVNIAVSAQLEPGLYWFATNADNGTAAFGSLIASNLWMGSLIGSTAQNNLQGGSLQGLSVVQAFGTWPDLTSASFTEVTSATTIPLVQFKIGSVP